MVNPLHQVSNIIFSVILNLDVELIKNNAAVGSQIAIAYSQLNKISSATNKELIRGRGITVIGGAAVDIIS